MQDEQKRQVAVKRYEQGEKPESIWVSLKRSKRWFYKWLERYQTGSGEWYKSQSCRALHYPLRTPRELEALVVDTRLSLYNAGLFYGAQAIEWELQEQGVSPLPSRRTINRIIKRNELTHRRTGRYIPKGKQYPKLPANKPGAVHQVDRVGPCYLKGPIRFYSLHSVDVHTGRCAVAPSQQVGGQALIDSIWGIWQRLGLPRYQQIDNEMAFFGSPANPRGMGQLIRLCLHNGIELCFIPYREPWWNGVVEKFNDHWEQKFYHRQAMYSMQDVQRESLLFEHKHNTRMKYSKLGGRTPLQALQQSGHQLDFPADETAPCIPLKKPDHGKYHVCRFIRSNGILDIFTEHFPVPPEAIYEYVQATVDVGRQRLQIRLAGKLIDELPYKMRK